MHREPACALCDSRRQHALGMQGDRRVDPQQRAHSLHLAETHEVESIAFPAVGMGIAGCCA
jgi:O-acetyl-ADP-ribose deacetylase (regulator of RNase III)